MTGESGGERDESQQLGIHKSALVFGLIFAFAFPLYSLDHQNSATTFANWIAREFHFNGDHVARRLFAFAALLVVVAAYIRTWASSYLHADVVYASQVKTESLVADGPYRRGRNPLYFANLLMAFGMGAMMSRTGFAFAVRKLHSSRAATLALSISAHCIKWKESRLDDRIQGRILVLGLRGISRSLCTLI